MATTITLDELRKALDGDEPITLVEALGPLYFEEAHLPGAINVPHERVAELAPDLLPDRDAAIVVYCASVSCANSRIAADTLVSLGYTNVRVYHEGKAEWIAAGLPVESAAAVTT